MALDVKRNAHVYLLYALAIGFASCALFKHAGVPLAAGTAAGVFLGGGVPLFVAAVAAAGTWTASAIVEKVSPPAYSGPPYTPPHVPWYDPAQFARYLIGWALIVLVLWFLAKRWKLAGHFLAGLTLGASHLLRRKARA